MPDISQVSSVYRWIHQQDGAPAPLHTAKNMINYLIRVNVSFIEPRVSSKQP